MTRLFTEKDLEVAQATLDAAHPVYMAWARDLVVSAVEAVLAELAKGGQFLATIPPTNRKTVERDTAGRIVVVVDEQITALGLTRTTEENA